MPLHSLLIRNHFKIENNTSSIVMTGSKDWKSKLISSSLPFEFEAAKILIAHDFVTTSDYTYSRDDLGVIKDFSVDLRARDKTPFTTTEKNTAELNLLVECKQRNPNIKWLFLPEINHLDLSPVVTGVTIRVIDEFCKNFLPINSTIDFDCKGPFCYKGIEIDEKSGNVFDSELKHGISQLQYALPRLISQCIRFHAVGFPEDNIPFFICPILLTSSELYILNRDVEINNIKSATSLNDIAEKVPFLVYYSDYGPDFEKHCMKEFSMIKNLKGDKRIYDLEQYLKKIGYDDLRLPANLIDRLCDCDRYDLTRFFTQFVICSIDTFPSLLMKIKYVVSKATEEISSKLQSTK